MSTVFSVLLHHGHKQVMGSSFAYGIVILRVITNWLGIWDVWCSVVESYFMLLLLDFRMIQLFVLNIN